MKFSFYLWAKILNMLFCKLFISYNTGIIRVWPIFPRPTFEVVLRWTDACRGLRWHPSQTATGKHVITSKAYKIFSVLSSCKYTILCLRLHNPDFFWDALQMCLLKNNFDLLIRLMSLLFFSLFWPSINHVNPLRLEEGEPAAIFLALYKNIVCPQVGEEGVWNFKINYPSGLWMTP